MFTVLFLNWLLSMVIVCGAFKWDFGEVTVGDFVFFSIVSMIPLSCVAALIFALMLVIQSTGVASKKLF